MIQYTDVNFDYEPYPIAYLKDFVPQDIYTKLAASFPDQSIFDYKPKLGEKYALSEIYNPEAYHNFLNSSTVWKEFHQYIKSEAFITSTLRFLQSRNVDLGLNAAKPVFGRRTRSLLSRIKNVRELTSRFEFSIMKGNGGSIRPHTDTATKHVTISVSMMGPGEWDESWGGGTEVCLPKDRTQIYNRINRYMDFNAVEVVKQFPFVPNQAILFIKTYNSWHEVRPLQGPEGSLRKTLNINIEELV